MEKDRNTLNERNKKSEENKILEGEGPENAYVFLDDLKTSLDKDKREQHLKKMLEVYRNVSHHKYTGIVELKDSELDLAAAYTGSTRHMGTCPYCGIELPVDRLEEHKKLIHEMP